MIYLISDESILNIEPEEEHPTRQMYFDGAVNIHGNVIETVQISPSGAH